MSSSNPLRAGEGDRAGLVALQSDDYWYAITATRKAGRPTVELRRRAGPGDSADGVVVATAPLTASGPVRFQVTARGDRYDFAFAQGGAAWRGLAADQDGTLLSTKTAGGFIGVVLGPFAQAAR